MKRIFMVLILAILSVSALFAASYTIDESDTINLSGISKIIFNIKKPNCALCISTGKQTYSFTGGGSRNEIKLLLEGNISSNHKKAVPRLITDSTGGTVTVTLYENPSLFFGLVQSGSVYFQAELPSDFAGDVEIVTSSGDSVVENLSAERLSIRSSSGDIDAADLSADNLEIKASSGDISAVRLSSMQELYIHASSGGITIDEASAADSIIDSSSGRINIGMITASQTLLIEASSGKISADKVKGLTVEVESHSGRINIGNLLAETARIKSSSGKITINQLDTDTADISSSSGGLEIGSGSGSIRYDGSSGDTDITLSALNGDLDIENSSGDVTLSLPENSAFSANMRASSGRIRSDFQLLGDVSDNKKNIVVGEANGGGNSIRIKASSGNIDITER